MSLTRREPSFRPVDTLDIYGNIGVCGRNLLLLPNRHRVFNVELLRLCPYAKSQTPQSSLLSSFRCALTPGRSLSNSSRSCSIPPSLTTPQLRRCTIKPITWRSCSTGFQDACVPLLVPPATGFSEWVRRDLRNFPTGSFGGWVGS